MVETKKTEKVRIGIAIDDDELRAFGKACYGRTAVGIGDSAPGDRPLHREEVEAL